MSTTITAPGTQAQMPGAGTAKSFEVSTTITMALMDGLDVLGLFDGAVNLTGLNTTAQRQAVASGIGFSKRMTASGSEDSPNAASTFDLDYSSVSVAQYDLTYSQSIMNQVISNGATMTLDELKALLPQNYLATLRYLRCVSGSGISVLSVGSASVAASMDDVYDLAAAVNSKLGAAALGAPDLTIDPAQWNSIIAAARSEPAFVQNMAAFQNIQKIQGGQRIVNPFGFGFDVSITDDVVQSGGAYKGFCVSMGAIRRAFADPSRANIPAAVNPIYMPEFGLVVYDTLSTLTTAVLGWQAIAFIGTGRQTESSSLQVLFTSLV